MNSFRKLFCTLRYGYAILLMVSCKKDSPLPVKTQVNEFQKTYGDANNEYAKVVIEASNGNYLLSGFQVPIRARMMFMY